MKGYWKNQEIVISCCSYHILHNAFNKSAETFEDAVDFSIKITVWIFFTSLGSHPNGNRSWKNTMTSAIKTIRFQHVGCVQSIPVTRNWNSILAYGPVFYLSLKRISDFLRLNEAFLKTRTEFYLIFFQTILPMFTHFNNAFQTHEPLIQCLDGKMQASMNK